MAARKIASTGEAFDPNLHQALQMQPSEEFEANTVMQDLRPGFQLARSRAQTQPSFRFDRQCEISI